jgi:hypothetical protein
MAGYPDSAHDYIVASYRYLRLAMVVLVVTLGASLVIEMWGAPCWQGSISAYYWTPVHAIFIGALVAIGALLIALKGRDSIEDVFFNLAGVLAPIVALVPTRRPSRICSDPGDEVTVDAAALVRNNVPALGIALAITVVVALLVAKDDARRGVKDVPRAAWVGLAMSAVLLVVGVVWYFAFHDSFERRAHGTSAIAMFVFIWGAVMVNAGWPPRLLAAIYRALGETRDGAIARPAYRAWYRAVAVYMVVAAVVVPVAFGLADSDHMIFWLEAAEILPFGVFWSLQTAEAWKTGVKDLVPAPS